MCLHFLDLETQVVDTIDPQLLNASPISPDPIQSFDSDRALYPKDVTHVASLPMAQSPAPSITKTPRRKTDEDKIECECGIDVSSLRIIQPFTVNQNMPCRRKTSLVVARTVESGITSGKYACRVMSLYHSHVIA